MLSLSPGDQEADHGRRHSAALAPFGSASVDFTGYGRHRDYNEGGVSTVKAATGRKRWAIAEGYIPGWSSGPEPQPRDRLHPQRFGSGCAGRDHGVLLGSGARRSLSSDRAGPVHEARTLQRSRRSRTGSDRYRLRERYRVGRADSSATLPARFTPGRERAAEQHGVRREQRLNKQCYWKRRILRERDR